MTEPTARLSAFRPTEGALHPPVLAPSDVSYVVEDTAIGRMLLARNDSGALVASAFVATSEDEDHVLARLSERVSPRVLRQPRELDDARTQLDDFLAGRTREFTLRTDLALASDFQRTVLPRLAATVHYGDRATYGELAASMARPKAARAVGAALGANPLCVVLPCHRVVASSGALTGYAGGLAAKRYLLELEASHR
ncbi:methylated-DNA-[protein]-cysteine S-methyltransferase [Phycicoccus badiiscoriae]|uniref:methylated-DNA--[protein]-cysteine S-methyltransferase n=1 Tax=Pedococcus badiiscoriae TaxID=642776 RepID=A0A852WDJ0_9MICO|nr:methylated-DNA--[protein]-cysteine S-methyltransferase [Pedococcus badiiscoriae]NYG06849.1 methylated-DNA-[protein]-cysteine S-methyltransferase [Pedococcus badiiscoriae]